MIYELKPNEFYKVDNFFQQNEMMNVQWIITGNRKGQIFVENTENPKTVVAHSHNCYMLDGDCSNKEFIKAIREYSIKKHCKDTFMTVWEVANNQDTDILEEILEDPVLFERHIYDLNNLDDFKFDWRSKTLPASLEIKQFDRDFFQKDRYKTIYNNLNPMMKECFDGYNTPEDFLNRSGGFYIFDKENNTIASMAPTIYNSLTNSNSVDIHCLHWFY